MLKQIAWLSKSWNDLPWKEEVVSIKYKVILCIYGLVYNFREYQIMKEVYSSELE